MNLKFVVTVQNPSPDIRIFALNSAFSSLAGRKMLISRVVTLFEPPYEFENQPLTCKHDDADYRILRGSE